MEVGCVGDPVVDEGDVGEADDAVDDEDVVVSDGFDAVGDVGIDVGAPVGAAVGCVVGMVGRAVGAAVGGSVGTVGAATQRVVETLPPAFH